MSLETKTIGQIIDQFVTVQIRCWMAQERIMDQALTESERLDAAITAQKQNAIRTELIRIIDKKLGDESTTNTSKTYLKEQ